MLGMPWLPVIRGYSALQISLSHLQWGTSKSPYLVKLEILSNALECTLQSMKSLVGDPLHLALSGGMDSTLLLYRLLRMAHSVEAHTMANTEQHPDMAYARMAVLEAPKKIPWHQHIVTPPSEVGQDVSDLYIPLMQKVSKFTTEILCGDCIDELLGGYYSHQTEGESELAARKNRLIPEHLDRLDAASSRFGVGVWLPYGNPEVIRACSQFTFSELVDSETRKRPLYDLAAQIGVPTRIRLRRKYGLCSALDSTRR